MTANLPDTTKYLIIGAGIHGLSTAYHLALALKSRARGNGKDILVVDKRGVAAGASGIACGVVRNNYSQSAMRELMAHSVEVWESDPQAYSYHPVGYIQLAPEIMEPDVIAIAKEQKQIGYESSLILGETRCTTYMRQIFSDWQATGITSALHEKRGGYANNVPSMRGLAAKAEHEGVQILTDVEVTGFRSDSTSSSITGVQTNVGSIECDYVVVAPGPWAKHVWELLELPKSVTLQRNGDVQEEVPMWVFWHLQEGTLGVDPKILMGNDGSNPPVIHVDSTAPLYSQSDGSLITDQMWGIYYKPDFRFDGVQGGGVPQRINTDPDDVKVDPYGTESLDYVVNDQFAELWVSALVHCQKRFEGLLSRYRKEPSGGIGAFTPDNFPIFDVFRENCYFIADSNHGYKMIGVGKLVAQEICGEESALMTPFRFARYAQGQLHPVSNSPFPWS